jgi:hypothetical protein
MLVKATFKRLRKQKTPPEYSGGVKRWIWEV